MIPVRRFRQRTFFDKPAQPVKADGPACLKWHYPDTIITPGKGPHHARIDCPNCGAWRWLPRPRPARGGGSA